MKKKGKRAISATSASYGGVVALVVGILCGIVTLAGFFAKPDGWPYAVAILFCVGMGLGITLWRISGRANLIRCGAKDVGSPLFCGKKVPRWFVDKSSGISARCGVCVSGGQLRYPEHGETEEHYNAYVAAFRAEQDALTDEYARIVGPDMTQGP